MKSTISKITLTTILILAASFVCASTIVPEYAILGAPTDPPTPKENNYYFDYSTRCPNPKKIDTNADTDGEDFYADAVSFVNYFIKTKCTQERLENYQAYINSTPAEFISCTQNILQKFKEFKNKYKAIKDNGLCEESPEYLQMYSMSIAIKNRLKQTDPKFLEKIELKNF